MKTYLGMDGQDQIGKMIWSGTFQQLLSD